MDLNPNQLKAVKHKSGPLLIIAGAGTGKTKVITERIGHILNEKWAQPSEVLALTFTEKAANEMEERVDVMMPLGYEQPWISTFHSFADKILKQEGIYIGLDSSYSLMTQSEAYILFRRNLFAFPLKKFRPLGNPTRFISDILSHFSRLQDEDVSPQDYIDYANNLKATTKEEQEVKEEAMELSATYKMYSEVKIVNSKLDFGDLIITVLRLFRTKPNILEKYHKQFKYILVDEFQDTNYTQNVLVNLLALGKEEPVATAKDRKSANITVVGDDDQAIYKFRGAAISNILQFKKSYPEAKSVVLTTNYRSNQAILDVAYKLVKHNNPYRLEVKEKIDKQLKSEVGKGGEASVRLLHENTSDSEAEKIAQEITQLHKEGEYSFQDFAILVRANQHADEIIDTLRHRGIPYKLGGSRSLYQRPEVVILISFLKSLVNSGDAVSSFNILSMPQWQLKPRDIVEILRVAKLEKQTTLEVLERIAGKKIGSDESIEASNIKISTVGGIKQLVDIYDGAMEMLAKGKSAGEILYHFFEHSGLKAKYTEDDSGKNTFIVENVRKYFDMLNTFWHKNPGTNLYEYLDYLEYSAEVGESPTVDASSFDEYDAVNVLTIHSSKGLEFPVVFVANMVSERFPSRNRQDTIPIPDALIKEILPENPKAEHTMEERRLAYVAYTRAKEILYLTGAQYYGEGKRKKKLSPFIFESLDEEVIKQVVPEVESKEVKVKSIAPALDYVKLGIKTLNEFSYTQLHMYEMCPRQYKYEYILKLPSPISSASSFGSAVHNTLKNVYEQLAASRQSLDGFVTLPTKEDLIRYYRKNWISAGYDSKDHELKRYEEGEKSLSEYFDKFYSLKEKPLYIERSFEYALDDFKIRGRIDRIDLLEEKDGKKYVEIMDYKTGKVKDIKEAQKDWQLQLYAYIVAETMGFVVQKASYVYVEHCKKIEVTVDLTRRTQVLAHIREIVAKIRAGDFSVPEGHYCFFCEKNQIWDDGLI